ncbi:hypothetical protein H4R18_005328, partial [Coemansia javaensis]
YMATPINALRAAAERLRAAAGKLAGIVSLRLNMAANKRMLGWDGADAADHEADIQAICGDITAAMPGVRRLVLILKGHNSAVQELGRRLAVHYSGHLQGLEIAGPVAIPRGTEFRQLKRMNLEYGYIGTSRAPRVSPAGLKLLGLQGRLATTTWVSFASGARDREITFANLEVLGLASSPPAAMPSFAAQSCSRDAWRLYFPRLRHAIIQCSQGPFPVLEWVVFPPRMVSLEIDVAPAVLQVVDEAVDIPAAQRFKLAVPRKFGDDPAVLAMTRRVLEKAHRCEARELVAPGDASPLLIDMVVSVPITHLSLHAASVDLVADLIRRTSSITTLSIFYLNADNTQLDISVPPPGSRCAVEPLSTSITGLRFGWHYSNRKSSFALAAKYLLLAIPSLLCLVAPYGLKQQLVEFAKAHSACHPHLQNIVIRGLKQQLAEFAKAHSACHPHLQNIVIRDWRW